MLGQFYNKNKPCGCFLSVFHTFFYKQVQSTAKRCVCGAQGGQNCIWLAPYPSRAPLARVGPCGAPARSLRSGYYRGGTGGGHDTAGLTFTREGWGGKPHAISPPRTPHTHACRHFVYFYTNFLFSLVE